MKKAPKVISLILVLALFALIALGSGSTSEKKDIVDSSSTSSSSSSSSTSSNSSSEKTEATTASDESKVQDSAAAEPTKSDVPTIEEQVLLDYEGVVITAKSYETDSWLGDGIKLLIENNSDKNVGIGCNALIVNNYMVENLFSAQVAAGKKANETLTVFSSELKESGITNVGQIEAYFHLYDPDTYMTTYDAPCATLKTSLYDEMDCEPNDTGKELYNGEGMRIVGKYVEEDTIWGTAILLYMENNTGKNVYVTTDDMSINGFMVDAYLYSTIYDGKMCIDDITIFSSTLEENDIEEIEEIELVFRVVDDDTWNTIVETDPITFSAS